MGTSDARLWQAVARRDEQADGLFVYGVRSTKIFCRPSCPSRRPQRHRAVFFATPAEAEAAGYRPCRRCRPEAAGAVSAAAARVRRACEAIARRPAAPWTTATLAREAGASVPQLQRAFRAQLGLSPREFAAASRRRIFLDALRRGRGVTDAIYVAGYSSPSRAYSAVRLPGMKPATYGRGGAGARIAWTTTASPVGRILVAATPAGLCFVEIGTTVASLVARLRREFPEAAIDDRPSASLGRYARAARAVAERTRVPKSLPVDIRGTAFQWRVWRALTGIPTGETRSYADVAAAIGRPTAVRAVASACASNPIALVVPCHRVIGAGGRTGAYRWGAGVKRKLVERERGESAIL